MQVTLWQLSREKSLIAKRCEMKANSGHTSKTNFESEIPTPAKPVWSLLFDYPMRENRRHPMTVYAQQGPESFVDGLDSGDRFLDIR